MERLVIRNMEDLVKALPRLVNYRPDEGSIIVIDSTAQPIGVLYPELLNGYGHHDADEDMRLATDLRVFSGRSVVLLRVGYFGPLAFVERALRLLNANIIAAQSVSNSDVLAAFSGTASDVSRDEYRSQSENRAALDAALAKADRVAAERMR